MNTLDLSKEVLLDELMASIIHLNKSNEKIGLKIAFALAEMIKNNGLEFAADLHDKIREDAITMNRCPECYNLLASNKPYKCICGWKV